ncbi:MAG: AraC family transcriptional regulator [Bacteroidota bacterium]
MIKIKHTRIKSHLAKYVRKISVFECAHHMECKHRLIPSGCTYLSYNHKDIPTYFHQKKVKPSERLQITGPKTNPNIYVEYGDELLQILIEFTPAGFYYLFHDSPANYLNELVNLSHFEHHGSIESLTSQLLATDNSEALIDIIQDYLFEISVHALPFCNYIEEAVKVMEANIGNILVKDIAKAINKSERQFYRQFLKIVGVSPKEYSKLLQLHYAINLMNMKEISSIKEISYSANFYDQSHFDHRFNELVGITPNEFLISKEHNALKYFTDLVLTYESI